MQAIEQQFFNDLEKKLWRQLQTRPITSALEHKMTSSTPNC